jgi:uncharacterized protein (DUF2252 family)
MEANTPEAQDSEVNGRPAEVSEEGRRYPGQSQVPHPTPAERVARGKAARAEVPRASQGVFVPAENRPDPVALLESQAASRVPELVPIRYGRMGVSAFTFYRGAALIMASDLAATPTSGLKAQICGDAHLSNFGAFGSPERNLIFDINDFDETLPGPWEWDLKRLVASLEIAGRDNEFDDVVRRTIVLRAGRAYREAMREFSEMGNLAVWYQHLDLEAYLKTMTAQIDHKRLKLLEKNLAKTRTRDSMQVLTKLTDSSGGDPRIVAQPPLIVPLEDLLPDDVRQGLEHQLHEILRGYRKTLETDRRHLLEQFRLVQIARKVVGVGSVGTRAWIGLLLGRDSQDPLFLQMKEAEESVLERFAGKSAFANHGRRVVAGQRLMQTASDIFLGWQHVTGVDGVERDFYVRQLRDWKGSAEIGAMLPDAMELYAHMCGWTLARAHARSGDRIAIAAYLGKGDALDRAMADFAVAYADQNEKDYAAMQAAVASGRLVAEAGY